MLRASKTAMPSNYSMEESQQSIDIGILIEELDANGGWKPLQRALVQRKGYVDWTEDCGLSEHGKVCFVEGHGSHHLDLDVKDRSFHSYSQRVLQPRIQTKAISDGSEPGSFDDRKLRWSDTHVSEIVVDGTQDLRLAVGPTWFQQCQLDIHRQPTEAIQLMMDGLQHYNDPYAFFARGMGVVAIPITREGHAFIGSRAQTYEYNSHLCFVGGWLSFISQPSRIDIYSEIERELKEEIHFSSPSTRENIRLVGLSGHPFTGEADLVFVVQTDLADDHFAQGSWCEHREWFPIRNASDAQQLLVEGFPQGSPAKFEVMFSSKMGLDFLAKSWWPE